MLPKTPPYCAIKDKRIVVQAACGLVGGWVGGFVCVQVKNKYMGSQRA
jgi:hypothetical protein